MGKLFTLDAATILTVTDALDDLITEFGKNCRLVYPPKYTVCVNCVTDPIGHKSSNIYKHGGPIPFANLGICPMCNGEGRRAEEVTEEIKLLCVWEPKQFFVPIPSLDIKVPFGFLQTKGFLKDSPKIMRADSLIFQIPIEGIVRKRYRLKSQPGDPSNIIQNRYFIALWEQYG